MEQVGGRSGWRCVIRRQMELHHFGSCLPSRSWFTAHHPVMDPFVVVCIHLQFSSFSQGGINTWGNTALLFTCCSWDFIGQVGGGGDSKNSGRIRCWIHSVFQEWHQNIVPLRLCHRSSWEKKCGDSKDHSHRSRNHYFSIFHEHNIPLNITLRRQVTHFHFPSHTNGIKNPTE